MPRGFTVSMFHRLSLLFSLFFIPLSLCIKNLGKATNPITSLSAVLQDGAILQTCITLFVLLEKYIWKTDSIIHFHSTKNIAYCKHIEYYNEYSILHIAKKQCSTQNKIFWRFQESKQFWFDYSFHFSYYSSQLCPRAENSTFIQGGTT